MSKHINKSPIDPGRRAEREKERERDWVRYSGAAWMDSLYGHERRQGGEVGFFARAWDSYALASYYVDVRRAHDEMPSA